jgi:hypothetical protein
MAAKSLRSFLIMTGMLPVLDRHDSNMLTVFCGAESALAKAGPII